MDFKVGNRRRYDGAEEIDEGRSGPEDYLKRDVLSPETRSTRKGLLAACLILGVATLTPVRVNQIAGIQFGEGSEAWITGILLAIVLWFGVSFYFYGRIDWTRLQLIKEREFVLQVPEYPGIRPINEIQTKIDELRIPQQQMIKEILDKFPDNAEIVELRTNERWIETEVKRLADKEKRTN